MDYPVDLTPEYIEAHCAGDPALRWNAEAMIGFHEDAIRAFVKEGKDPDLKSILDIIGGDRREE